MGIGSRQSAGAEFVRPAKRIQNAGKAGHSGRAAKSGGQGVQLGSIVGNGLIMSNQKGQKYKASSERLGRCVCACVDFNT